MAITIRHDASPGAIGMAAYMGGLGKARQRKQKYAFDLFRDERRRQSRIEEQYRGFKYSQTLHQQRRQD